MLFYDYLERLKTRSKKSKIYKKYQLVGLRIASILGDEKHKTFYIKLAKYNNEQDLMNLAKISVEKKNIKNSAAYFVKIAKERGFIDKIQKEFVPKQQKIKFGKNVRRKKQ